MAECEIQLECKDCHETFGYSDNDHSLEDTYQCISCANKEDEESD